MNIKTEIPMSMSARSALEVPHRILHATAYRYDDDPDDPDEPGDPDSLIITSIEADGFNRMYIRMEREEAHRFLVMLAEALHGEGSEGDANTVEFEPRVP